MGHVEKNLVPGETIVYKTGCHWIVLVWPFATGTITSTLTFVFLASAYFGAKKGNSFPGMLVLGALAGIVTVALVGGGIIRKAATEVGVSNKRVLIKTGFFSRKSIEVLLPKVESISVNDSFLGRILGYGSVVVRGTGGTFETFNKIALPNELRRQVQEQIGTAVSA